MYAILPRALSRIVSAMCANSSSLFTGILFWPVVLDSPSLGHLPHRAADALNQFEQMRARRTWRWAN